MADPKCRVTFATHDYANIKCGTKRFSVYTKNNPTFGKGTWKKWKEEIESLKDAKLSVIKRKYGNP